jgi:hypothetical protein
VLERPQHVQSSLGLGEVATVALDGLLETREVVLLPQHVVELFEGAEAGVQLGCVDAPELGQQELDLVAVGLRGPAPGVNRVTWVPRERQRPRHRPSRTGVPCLEPLEDGAPEIAAGPPAQDPLAGPSEAGAQASHLLMALETTDTAGPDGAELRSKATQERLPVGRHARREAVERGDDHRGVPQGGHPAREPGELLAGASGPPARARAVASRPDQAQEGAGLLDGGARDVDPRIEGLRSRSERSASLVELRGRQARELAAEGSGTVRCVGQGPSSGP